MAGSGRDLGDRYRGGRRYLDARDTAAFYFSALRSAKELINRALAPYPDDLVIATKVGPGRDPSGSWLDWARPEQLRGQVEENLRQLGRDHLDVVNLRLLGPGSIAEHVGVLADLRDAGLIRHLGISNARPEHLTEARAIAPVVCVQNRYSLDSRRPDADAFLRTCGEQGVAFVPFFAIAGNGREGGATIGERADVLAVAREHGVTATQVRLAWTLARGPHVLAIPGTGNPDHLVANIAAGGLHLSPHDMRRLDSLDGTTPENRSGHGHLREQPDVIAHPAVPQWLHAPRSHLPPMARSSGLGLGCSSRRSPCAWRAWGCLTHERFTAADGPHCCRRTVLI